MANPITTYQFDQSDLIKRVGIPVELGNDFCAMKISSPKDLTQEKITSVVDTALQYSIYAKCGFGLNSGKKCETLKASLKELEDSKITFYVWASSYGARGGNIDSTFINMK